MSALLARLRALPRAAQWGVWAALALVAYFAIVEPTLELRAAWASKADDKSQALVALARGTREGDEVELGIRRFGVVKPPGDPRERADAFNRRINEVLKSHEVTDHTGTTRTISLTTGPLNSALDASGQRVDRFIREIQFEAAPETLAAVLADLERSPEVAAVSKVQVRKSEEGGGRLLRATVSVEAWVLARKGGSR